MDGVTNEFPWVGDKIIEWDADGNEVWTWDLAPKHGRL